VRTQRPRKATVGAGRRASAPPGRVRIVGGRLKRSWLRVAPVEGLRPTPDRVRETIFNWFSHLAGSLDGKAVLDLFAGTGALGIEAASRGAREVVLVERHPLAAEALREAKTRLDVAGLSVLEADWREAIARLPPATFDLIFLDPPFDSGWLAEAMRAARALLAPGGVVYVEAARTLDPAAAVAQGFELLRADRAGAVHYHLLRAQP
jgi:16S rRNA (guanine966-N2)-methyltransferase